MKIIDNATTFVNFDSLQSGDVFKAYDVNCYCMKIVNEIDTVDNESFNAINLSNGNLEWFRGSFQVKKLNATLTVD